MNLADKAVVITGGATGIGRAPTVAFARAGAKVVMAAVALSKILGWRRGKAPVPFAVCPHCGRLFEPTPGHVCPHCGYPLVVYLKLGTISKRNSAEENDQQSRG